MFLMYLAWVFGVLSTIIFALQIIDCLLPSNYELEQITFRRWPIFTLIICWVYIASGGI